MKPQIAEINLTGTSDWSYQDSVDRGSIQSTIDSGHNVRNQDVKQEKADVQVH